MVVYVLVLIVVIVVMYSMVVMLNVVKVWNVFVLICCDVYDSLFMLIVIVSDEFFMRFMYWLNSGGSVMCMVCGSIM